MVGLLRAENNCNRQIDSHYENLFMYGRFFVYWKRNVFLVEATIYNIVSIETVNTDIHYALYRILY